MIALPRLIIFDLDGTLIEYELDYIFSKGVEKLPEAGYPDVSLETLNHWFALDNMFGFAPPEEQGYLTELFWNWFESAEYPEPRLIDGADYALTCLKKNGIRSALVTGRVVSKECLEGVLKSAGIIEHFDTYIARRPEDLNWRDKSHLYREACTCVSADPKDVLVVGDNPSDICSAHTLGAGGTVGVLSGRIYREILEAQKPDVVLQSVAELPSYLGLIE